MSDLRMVGGEIWNFGPLHDPSERGGIRMVQTPRGEEIRYVIGAR